VLQLTEKPAVSVPTRDRFRIVSARHACQTRRVRHALASLIGVVRRSIADHAMLRPGERVLVALSGGADSTGLALVLSELRRRLGIDVVAGHVHHGLRGSEADLDQERAAATAAALGIPFEAVAIAPGALRGANLEARARTARYAALRRIADAAGCTKVATGHTMDDQAETFLLRLLRGAGSAGLAAIQPHRDDGVVRPLIACRRAAVVAVVEQAGLGYRVDSANSDPRFLRTAVRERLLPLLVEIEPAAVATCARAAEQARGDALLAERWLAAALGEIGPELPVAALGGLPIEARAAVARYWLMTRLGSGRGIASAHIAGVLALAAGENGRAEVHLPRGRVVRRRRGVLTLAEADPAARRRVPRKSDAQADNAEKG